MNGVMRFNKYGKFILRYIGSFETLKIVESVTYRLALPLSLLRVHPIFYVVIIKKFHGDNDYIIHWDSFMIDKNLSYKEELVNILDRDAHKLRINNIAALKIQWKDCLRFYLGYRRGHA